jgi:hypothetical protein
MQNKPNLVRLLQILNLSKDKGVQQKMNNGHLVKTNPIKPARNKYRRQRRPQLSRYETPDTRYDFIGDEGSRTLISAMRPRRAPVTPRPLSHYVISTYNHLKLPFIVTYYILYRLPAGLSSTFPRRITKCHKFNYSNILRNPKYLPHLLRIERPNPARPQS